MKRDKSLPAGIAAGLMAIVMLLATGTHGWAQQQESAADANKQLGEVVNVSENQITIRTDTGEQKTFDVSKDVQIQLDNQKTDLQDLKQGDKVVMTFKKDAPNQASSLQAFREQQERFTSRREALEARRRAPDAQRPALGVVIQETPDQKGVKVLRVRPDSPAAKAGIQTGDVIMSINDQNVDSPDKLSDLISDKKPGDKLSVSILREGQEKKIEATVGSRGEAFGRREGMRSQRREAGREEYEADEPDTADQKRAWLGLFLDEATDQKGVEILRIFPGGPADRAGLESGDVILSIAGKEVASPSDIVDALADLQSGQTTKVEILRDNEKQTLDIKTGDRSRFLREQRRFREGTPFRGRERERFGPGADRFGGEAPWSMMDEQQREDAEQRQRLERLGQQMLQELRALREDVQQLQEDISEEPPTDR